MRNIYTKEQKKEILIHRDKDALEFSEICKIMKLSQRKARSLYQCAKTELTKNVKQTKQIKKK